MTTPQTLEAAMQEALTARGITLNAAEPADVADDFGTPDFASAFVPPTSPEHYQITLPADFQRDAVLEAKARQWFHRASLPQGAVNGIVDAYCRQLCGSSVFADDSQTLAELKRDWGDAYPQKIAAAQALIARCGDAEEVAVLMGRTGLGNDPWLIRTLAALGEIDPQTGQQP